MKIFEVISINGTVTIVAAPSIIDVSNAYQEANSIKVLHQKSMILKENSNNDNSEVIKALILLNEKVDQYWNAPADDRERYAISIQRAQRNAKDIIDTLSVPNP